MSRLDYPNWLPLPGSVIAARYRVEGLLGAGGMGAVVAARHVGLDQRVAVKFLSPAAATDKDAIGRFLNEARAASRLGSEHAVRVLDVGAMENGQAYIAMELLVGEDLGARIAKGPLPLGAAVDIVLQAALGLAEAHAAGIIHRDVKPSNLWISQRKDGSELVKLLDFGISKVVEADGPAANMTQTQAAFGSPLYMSPEQIRSAKRVDPRTDVWALGVVLFEALTGRVPFDAETMPGLLASISADAPTPLRAVASHFPPEVEEAILRCLVKDREQRASLAELALRLQPFAGPTGALAASRISTLAADGKSASANLASIRPAATTQPIEATPRRSDSLSMAFGATEPTLSGPRPRSTPGVVFMAPVLAVAATLALGGTFYLRHQRKTLPAVSAPVERPSEPVAVAPSPSGASSSTPSATADPPSASVPRADARQVPAPPLRPHLRPRPSPSTSPIAAPISEDRQ